MNQNFRINKIIAPLLLFLMVLAGSVVFLVWRERGNFGFISNESNNSVSLEKVEKISGVVVDSLTGDKIKKFEAKVSMGDRWYDALVDGEGYFSVELPEPVLLLDINYISIRYTSSNFGLYKSDYEVIDYVPDGNEKIDNGEMSVILTAFPSLKKRVVDVRNAIEIAYMDSEYDLLWDLIYPDERMLIEKNDFIVYLRNSFDLAEGNCQQVNYFSNWPQSGAVEYLDDYKSAVTGNRYTCVDDCKYDLALVSVPDLDDMVANYFYYCQEPVEVAGILFGDKLYFGKKDNDWYLFPDLGLGQNTQKIADKWYQIKGKVIEKQSNLPMPGVKIELGYQNDCQRGKYGWEIVSDSDGSYSFDKIDRFPRCLRAIYGNDWSWCLDPDYDSGYNETVVELENSGIRSIDYDIYIDHWQIFDLQQREDVEQFAKQVLAVALEGDYYLLWDFLHPDDKELFGSKDEYVDLMNSRRNDPANFQEYYAYKMLVVYDASSFDYFDQHRPEDLYWESPANGKVYDRKDLMGVNIFMYYFTKHSEDTNFMWNYEKIDGKWYFLLDDSLDKLQAIGVKENCYTAFK